MSIQLFIRTILIGAFQDMTCYYCKDAPTYNDRIFYLPRIHSKEQDFSVSIQVHNGNYCNSENGYREFGYNFTHVEFGYPSIANSKFKEYAEYPNDICYTVGNIPIEVVESIFADYGGIDWDKTLDKDNIINMFKMHE